MERLGATVLIGESYDDNAESYAKQRAEQDGLTFVPPFDHLHVIRGQGTIGMEIERSATCNILRTSWRRWADCGHCCLC